MLAMCACRWQSVCVSKRADVLNVLASVQDSGGLQRSVGRNAIWSSDLCVCQCVISWSKRPTVGRNAGSAYFKFCHLGLFVSCSCMPSKLEQCNCLQDERLRFWTVWRTVLYWPPSILSTLSEILGWCEVQVPHCHVHILLPHERAAAGPALHVWVCHCPLHCVPFTLRLNGDAKVNRVEMHR